MRGLQGKRLPVSPTAPSSHTAPGSEGWEGSARTPENTQLRFKNALRSLQRLTT